MENYIEKMEELITVKKSKGHKINRKESEEYSDAWQTLIKAEGTFSEKAEKYFYDGFIFTGAKPFVTWVLATDDPFSSLDSMIKGNLFGKDIVTTFRILVSTLANLLMADLPDANLICPIIKAIPRQSKNKEKKTIGDAHKILLKYYVDEMDVSAHCPALDELTLNPAFINEFVSLMDELMEQLKTMNLSDKQKLVIAGTRIWLHPNETIVVVNDTAEIQSETSPSPKKESSPEIMKDSLGTPINSSDIPTEQERPKNPHEKLMEMLKQAYSLTVHLEKKASSAERDALTRETNLRHEIDLLKSQKDEELRHIESLNSQLDDRNHQITVMNDQIHNLEKTIESLKTEISVKETEISNRTQMIEALSRDRARQSDEVANRLSSKLKVEYRDFMDAQELPMDADLGENMREQLKNVFDILEKAGISLN